MLVKAANFTVQSSVMKNIYSLLLLSLIAFYSANAQTNKVLLIGIDGCRPDALQAANTPNLDALMANGSYTFDAMNDGITISGPGWGSLLTGVWPTKHGITDNAFLGYDILTYPHLFRRIEEYDPSLNTVSVCQWSPINIFIASTAADVIVNVADHSTYVEDEAVNQLSTGDPDALFLHFDDVDHAGHGSGFTPDNPNYITAIETVDNSIGGVLTALYNRPNYANENWAIIVSTDHGGIGTSHGGTTFQERNIFMIVSGDSIPNQQIFADSALVTLPPVANCFGDSVQLYFDGSDAVNTAVNSAFDFGANQDFTVECRVRTSFSGDVAIVTDKDWDSGNNEGWVFSFNVGGGPWKVNVGDGSDRVDLEGGIIDDNEWHTLSATFDRDGDLTIYEDGTEVASGSLGAIGDINTSYPISFGADGDGGYGYTGHIAEVRVFNGLVSGSDINAWKCTALTNAHSNYADLIGYWRSVDGGSSTSIFDSSPTQANGTIDGASWENAADTIFESQFDYSNTPKQVDYMVSALEHLCIPINPAWNLDGNVFGTSCSQTVGIESTESDNKFSIRTNELLETIEINSEESAVFNLIDQQGRTIKSEIIQSAHTASFSTANLS
ncbi:MAG: hypothetical protein ACI9P8_000818, partial [Bacteroidia bacterium]